MIRQPAVAGFFYPADTTQLRNDLASYLKEAKNESKVPKAMIVPHAGYKYSGTIAATAYSRLLAARDTINSVLLIGPSHRVAFDGLAVSGADRFATPLGLIDLDKPVVDRLLQLPFVQVIDQAHAQEHSLEVQLPFLQAILDDFKIVPVVAGNASAGQVEQVIASVWDDPNTLVVISSDLSHYHDYSTAKRMDAQTSDYIENLDYEHLDYQSACGRVPISGLLKFARKKALTVKTIDLRNSGDTAGDKSRVVGYGAYVVG